MDGIMELAVELGKLTHRIEALEKRVLNTEAICCGMKPIGWDDMPEEEEKPTPDRLLQDGIDAIMSYQSPLEKGGKK